MLLFVCILLDILTGPAMLGFGDVITALFWPGQANSTTSVIVWDIRLPMSLMAIVVGAALAVAGVIMQTILGNPLASPYTLGFSAAAGFGAAVIILTGITLPVLSWLTVPIAAFASTMVSAALVYGLARARGMTPEVMVLAGIATLFLFQSLQSLVQYLAAPEVLQSIVFWLFGSLLKASWDNLPITTAILGFCVLAILPDVWRLTALRLGDERAAAVGVNVTRLRVRMFVIVALLTAGAVAFVGTIGFIGLVAPHVARGLVGEDQRFLLPMSAICGAIIMSGASILSKLISPGSVIPIGIVTAVLGVPFLFGLIVLGKRRHW
ncbi:FecCD family ABC transporter permease [Roseovarius rhodophyticola]|uniref:Iron ABC transporter permease n=1 Tax=Roseovarius rhodophyticola TaxID=3080827 RepID=A0ABZ2TH72_9RHOB|nr:iron ABC transporter permease [Roseovarius sp. W115]MDV2929325.1 iron ABC transporter permease [Roseovarius sp. W115]